MAVKTFLLDQNAIVDVEDNRVDGPFVSQLIEKHNEGLVDIVLAKIIASERQQGTNTIRETYQSPLERPIGRLFSINRQPKLLRVPVFYDLTYWDESEWIDEDEDELYNTLESILFPKNGAKKTNEMCDVLVMWAFIDASCDFLITRDSNFHKKRALLPLRNDQLILKPQEVLEHLPLTEN